MVKTSRYLCIGPGGRRCNCCFPAPRSKDRRAQYRYAKRKADREAMRNAEQDMIDSWAELEETQRAMKMEDAQWSQYDDDWTGYDDPMDQIEDDSCYDYYDGPDDYYRDDYYDGYFAQSEQEKVARALSVALIGDELDWRQHLTHAMKFMEAMKRNGQ